MSYVCVCHCKIRLMNFDVFLSFLCMVCLYDLCMVCVSGLSKAFGLLLYGLCMRLYDVVRLLLCLSYVCV